MHESRHYLGHALRNGLAYSRAQSMSILLVDRVGFWWVEPRVQTLGDRLRLAFTNAAAMGLRGIVPSTHAHRGACDRARVDARDPDKYATRLMNCGASFPSPIDAPTVASDCI